MREKWHAMYLGAFAALGIQNTNMATELSELTETTQECVHTILVLKRSPEGDRVYPALQSLRQIRSHMTRPS